MSENKVDRKFTDRELLSIVIRYAKRHRRNFNIVLVMLVVNTVLLLSTPIIFHQILTTIEFMVDRTDQQADQIINGLIAYVGVNLFAWLANSVLFMNVTKLNSRVTRDIRIDAYSSIIKNKVLFFDQEKAGDINSRIVNDTKELFESVRHIAWLVTDLFRLLTTIAVLFYFSVVIAAATLILIPIIFVTAVILGKYERKFSRIWRKKFAEVNNQFMEIMSKIQISKAFNREEENLLRFRDINEETYQASIKRALAIFIFWPMTDLFKHLFLFLILLVGSYEVERGLPIATFVLFILLINYFFWPLISISENYQHFQSAFASLERIANMSEVPEIKEEMTGEIKADFSGHIRFDHVNFGYTPNLRVLHDITFEIMPGSRIAIVGATGAGKSTITNLLMRFYEIEDGDIYYDNHSIKEFNRDSLRSEIGYVSQRVLLFKGSLRDNLLLANPDATDDDIWRVLEMVQAKEFIDELTGKLDFRVSDGGKNLSAGQKQLISFARALLSDHKILILDEASSAVDLYTESKIQEAIETLLNSRTSISIAHRLTTILNADTIIVLENGYIVQMGSHPVLMEEDGPYKEMYELYLQTQSAKYLQKIKTKQRITEN